MPISTTWLPALAALAIGIAAGLVLRPLVADLLFGHIFRRAPPFGTGDFVIVRPADAGPAWSGMVQTIGPLATTLLTPQGRTLRLPHRQAAAATIEARQLATPGTEHTLDLVLDAGADRRRQAAALDAALVHAWADGFTVGAQAPRWHIDRLDGTGVTYRIDYGVDPRRHPEAAVRHVLLDRLHRHLHHAGLALAGGPGATLPIDPASTADRAACLGRTLLFEDLSADERHALASDLQVRHEDACLPVVSQGSPGTTMFIVAAGTLEVCVGATRVATAERLATIGPGEFFGEMAPLTGAPRSATVATLSPVLLFEIPPATLTALLRRKPNLAAALSRVMSEHLRRDADRASAP